MAIIIIIAIDQTSKVLFSSRTTMVPRSILVSSLLCCRSLTAVGGPGNLLNAIGC